MKSDGLLENWVSFERNDKIFIEGDIYGHGTIVDGTRRELPVSTEPPFFKSRIIQSKWSHKFYRLGESKE